MNPEGPRGRVLHCHKAVHWHEGEVMHTRVLLCFGLAVAALAADNNLTTTGVQRYFNGIRRNLEGAADAMPADKFSYKLTEGQMTFAQWLNHATDRNYSDCAILKGETAPMTGKEINALKDKAEVSKALKDSFAYCAAALEKVDD